MPIEKDVTWIDPNICDPPHRVTHPDKFLELVEMFSDKGWDTSKPVLLGYTLDKIQLISGSHRWAAANEVNIKIPVVVYSYDEIADIWGTDAWLDLLNSANFIEY
jgi:hypothetical protein